MPKKTLIEKAKKARNKAYAPYSKFYVGVALLAQDGTIFTGCNIENDSFPLSCCAERVAIFKAVSEGITQFTHMVILGEGKSPISPCGACRQVMAQFLSKDVIIYLVNMDGTSIKTSIDELLPLTFRL